MKKHHYLATTGISKIWDFDAHLLVLGHWCLISESNRNLLEGKEYTLIPSPWNPATKIKVAADYCYGLYEELIPTLSEKLNSLHGVAYPERYWRILIGYWLLIFIHQVYDRYIRIQHGANYYPNFHTSILPPEQSDLVSINTLDFSKNSYSDYFNLKLFSLILISLFPDRVSITPYDEKIVREPIRYSYLHKLAKKIIQKMSSGNIILSELYHIKLFSKFVLAKKSDFQTFTFLDFEPELRKCTFDDYSKKQRSCLELPSSSDPFRTLLNSLVPKALPMSYVEDYHIYKLSVQHEIRNYPGVIGSMVGWYFNERFKYFAAETVVKGKRLVDFQHGGGYGLSLSLPQEKICAEKDIFYSWGWETTGVNNITPLPSPYLSSLRDSHFKKGNEILFVGSAMPPYVYRFESGLFPDDMPDYFHKKKIFFMTLTPEVRECILYRACNAEYDWGEKEFVAGFFAKIRFLDKGNLTDWMQRAKLAIFDHPHTSFLEALTINIPTVLYWNHNIFLMRPEAEEYFELLRAADILHRSPEAASKKVCQIFDDPLSWWLQSDVQDARTKFCDRFALASKDWADEWIRKLKSIIP